jgi:hypothetical protein
MERDTPLPTENFTLQIARTHPMDKKSKKKGNTYKYENNDFF